VTSLICRSPDAPPAFADSIANHLHDPFVVGALSRRHLLSVGLLRFVLPEQPIDRAGSMDVSRHPTDVMDQMPG
jgi:hypothetical protein